MVLDKNPGISFSIIEKNRTEKEVASSYWQYEAFYWPCKLSLPELAVNTYNIINSSGYLGDYMNGLSQHVSVTELQDKICNIVTKGCIPDKAVTMDIVVLRSLVFSSAQSVRTSPKGSIFD